MTSCVNPIEHVLQSPGRSCRVDILVRDIYCEIYIDGVWMFTYSAPNDLRVGRMGFLVDGGAAARWSGTATTRCPRAPRARRS